MEKDLAAATYERTQALNPSAECLSDGARFGVDAGYVHQYTEDCSRGELRVTASGVESGILFDPKPSTFTTQAGILSCFFRNDSGHQWGFGFSGSHSPVIPGTYTVTFDYSLITGEGGTPGPIVNAVALPKMRNRSSSCDGGIESFPNLNFGDKAIFHVIVPDKGQLGGAQYLLSLVPPAAQAGDVDSKVPAPLTVKVANLDSSPASGKAVVFSTVQIPVGALGFSLDPGADVTDAQGIAKSTFALGNLAGDYVIEARCASCWPASVFFTVTASTANVSLFKYYRDVAAPAGDTLENAIIVQARNFATNQGVYGQNVQFQLIDPPAGALLSPDTMQTNKYGMARATLVLSPTPAVHQILATCESCAGNKTVTYMITGIEKRDSLVEGTMITAYQQKEFPDPQSKQPGIDDGFAGFAIRPIETTVAPAQANGNTQATFTLYGPEGTTFDLSVLPIHNSGGHIHNTSRPSGTVVVAGGQYVIGESSSVVLSYTAGEVGGQEMLVIKNTTNHGQESTAFVNVKVQGLIPLPVSSNYIASSNDGNHPSFTYGTPALISIINSVADEYKNVVTSDTLKISINDMSLINGGLFDIGGSWSTPHASHRVGEDVDINSQPINITTGKRSPKDSLPTKELILKIKSIFDRLGCEQIIEQKSIHFRC